MGTVYYITYGAQYTDTRKVSVQNASTPAFFFLFILLIPPECQHNRSHVCLRAAERLSVHVHGCLTLRSHSSLDDGRVYVCAALPSPPPAVVSTVPNSRPLSWFAANQKPWPLAVVELVLLTVCGPLTDAQTEKHQSSINFLQHKQCFSDYKKKHFITI